MQPGQKNKGDGEWIPKPGEWPVDPQEDVPVREDRIWIDGCFDFAHHGHAGAILQARKLGNELLVGVHSDEAILENKGPTVMTLEERVAAVDACRWTTKSIPHAPYVTSLPWITHYGCQYVVHGDDITSDSSGEDCYRFVKAAGRFKVVKRTPGISTTDLVGRMLLCTRTHFIKSLEKVLAGEEGAGTAEERRERGQEMQERIREYATDETGRQPGCEVWYWRAGRPLHGSRSSGHHAHGDATDSYSSSKPTPHEEKGHFRKMVEGQGPRPGQRVVYVDGGFDLFSSGHIEFLRRVVATEEAEARERGWYAEDAVRQRVAATGADYGPAYVVAGVHEDEVINEWKGVNYPIMNIFERGLCVLQCKYISALILGAPFTPTLPYLRHIPYVHVHGHGSGHILTNPTNPSLPTGLPAAVYHGPTTFIPLTFDPYAAARAAGIFRPVPAHPYAHVNAGQIVARILAARQAYEERQRRKGEKGEVEALEKEREEREREKEALRRRESWREVERGFGA